MESTINSLKVYAEAGAKAGEAARRKDMRLAMFHTNWLWKALALERPEHRQACKEVFDANYRANATPSQTPFQ